METNFSKTEKQKYRKIWESCDYSSGNAVEFANIVNGIIRDDHCFANIVDLGCGSGKTMKRLMELGYENVYGVDITLKGVKDIPSDRLLEAPLWNMLEGVLNDTDWPAPTYTISTDTLEHIPPELVEESIIEIIAITTIKTIHAICTRPCVVRHFGEELHLTIKPLSWWQHQFDRFNRKGIKIVLMDADRLHHYCVSG
jgi:hypothetical protein